MEDIQGNHLFRILHLASRDSPLMRHCSPKVLKLSCQTCKSLQDNILKISVLLVEAVTKVIYSREIAYQKVQMDLYFICNIMAILTNHFQKYPVKRSWLHWSSRVQQNIANKNSIRRESMEIKVQKKSVLILLLRISRLLMIKSVLFRQLL